MLRNAMVVSTDQRYEGIWSIFTQKALHNTKLAPNPWKMEIQMPSEVHQYIYIRMSETHFVSSHVNMIGTPTYNIYRGYSTFFKLNTPGYGRTGEEKKGAAKTEMD